MMLWVLLIIAEVILIFPFSNSVEANGIILSEMIFIPSGEFLMGSTEKDGVIGLSIGVDEIPQHKVFLKGFYIDKYEVTNEQYKLFINSMPYPPPSSTELHHSEYSWDGDSPPSGQMYLPVSHVSWNDAQAYCRWKEKRLPTEEEWEKAARGTDGRQWPWGNESMTDACNTRYTGPG